MNIDDLLEMVLLQADVLELKANPNRKARGIVIEAKLDKNMVGSNYYIESLQAKRDKDWAYRYNRVDIEEELEKQIYYSPEEPSYTPIEVVIRNVKSVTGVDLGTDWANISFRDLKHPCSQGSRYRFSLDYFSGIAENMDKLSEEDKHFNTSIWICVNRTPIRAGNTVTLRRCDTTLTMLGSTSGNTNDVVEMHLEPVVLESENKYTQVYYNMAVPVPQAEFYATMQCNYFTKHIKINDRFILGTIDTENRENNTVVKVKAINRAGTGHTYIQDSDDEIASTSLVVLSLDKDMISPDDDFTNRIASNAPIYKAYQQAPINVPYIKPVDSESIEVEIFKRASKYFDSFLQITTMEGIKLLSAILIISSAFE